MSLAPPMPDAIKRARRSAKHTQAQAADVVHSSARRWREWEVGDHKMHPGLWELYLLRTQGVIFDEPAEIARP
jgi:putative transcriptional regulator